MAAPAAHHTQDRGTPFDLQQPLVLPQAHRSDRPSASSSTGLRNASARSEQTPPLPLSPRKLSRTRNDSSCRVSVASNQIGGLDTGGLVVRGEPVTIEELRWARAKFLKRRIRRWRALKEGLGLIVLSWTTYQTVRYFVAFNGELSPQVAGQSLTLVWYFSLHIIPVYNEDTMRTRFAFALGLLSGLGITLLIIYKVFDYLVCLLVLASSDTDSAPHHYSASGPHIHQTVPVLHRLSLLPVHLCNCPCQRDLSSYMEIWDTFRPFQHCAFPPRSLQMGHRYHLDGHW